MSRRLLQRQSSSSVEVEQNQQDTADLGNRPIHDLWLRSDNKKKTSENTKIQENDLPVVMENVVTHSTATTQSSVDILNLSPNLSSPGSISGQDDEPDNSLLNQLQVRRSRPEHSPSDLSPNFSPSFSPRFVPQSRPRTLLAYLQNFGHNSQNLAANTSQSNASVQGDPRRTAVSFLSRIFGNNPPTPPQNNQETNTSNIQTQNTDEAVSVSTELTSYQPQHQITNTINNFPSGAIIVRTVQPGPNGSMIVNMRVLSIDDLLNQQDSFDGSESGNSGLFGSILNIFAGLQGVRTFTFNDLSSFLSEDRGLDKNTIDSLPAVTYEEEAFKNVDSESKKCTICLEHFEDGNEVRYLWCLHRFHKQCVDQWLDKHSNCPVCKKDYSENQDISE